MENPCGDGVLAIRHHVAAVLYLLHDRCCDRRYAPFWINSSLSELLEKECWFDPVATALTFLGVVRSSTVDLQMYGNLERIQQSRAYQVAAADSGYGEDVDVSTVGGAIQALPIGFAI